MSKLSSITLNRDKINLWYCRDYFYTTLANSMDYTSASFPVTIVNPDLDIPISREEFYNEEDKALHSVCK